MKIEDVKTGMTVDMDWRLGSERDGEVVRVDVAAAFDDGVPDMVHVRWPSGRVGRVEPQWLVEA